MNSKMDMMRPVSKLNRFIRVARCYTYRVMQGCVKRLVGMIRNIQPVSEQNYCLIQNLCFNNTQFINNISLQIQDSCCVMYATVHSIQYDSGWAYTACKSCSTRVTPIASKATSSRNRQQLWHCKKHGETYAVASNRNYILLKYITIYL